MRPKFGIRLFFWFLLACLSTFFAEVTVASSPLVFLKPDGWLLTVPVYGLHILVLAPLVLRSGRAPAWQSLYLFGTILGLYEAYMTKQLWSPTWNTHPISLAGVAVPTFLMLVLFWHPFMAFVVPLFAAEHFLGLQPAILSAHPILGACLKRVSFALLVGAGLGLMQGTLLGDPAVALASGGNFLLLFFLFWVWRRLTARLDPADRALTWPELLPRRLEWAAFLVLLLLDFAFLGLVLRREALPGLGSQVTIWICYVVLAWLAVKARSRQPVLEVIDPAAAAQPGTGSLRMWIAFSLAFVAVSVTASLLVGSLKNVMFIIVWGAGIPTGIFTLVKSIQWAFRKPAPRIESEPLNQ